MKEAALHRQTTCLSEGFGLRQSSGAFWGLHAPDQLSLASAC
jgi:hypothetical protein